MPEYEKMYAVLCGAISDALDNLSNRTKIRNILEEALLETEEMYISADSTPRVISLSVKTSPPRR